MSLLLLIEDHIQVVESLKPCIPQIEAVGTQIVDILKRGGKIILCGNGGSAADAQHIAAELVGRFELERKALAAIALTTDSSILTSLSNDYGYDDVFKRQIYALASPQDMLIAISTSGQSPSILKAVDAARECGCITVGLSGKDGGRLAKSAHKCIIVPSLSTARIQEAHILIGHMLCKMVDLAFHSSEK